MPTIVTNKTRPRIMPPIVCARSEPRIVAGGANCVALAERGGHASTTDDGSDNEDVSDTLVPPGQMPVVHVVHDVEGEPDFP